MSWISNRLLFFIPAGCLALGAAFQSPEVSPPVPESVTIGTYDTRAIALAWAASGFNDSGAKSQQLEAARQAGDQKKIRELEAWGANHQRTLHFQGFGRVPVSDLLEPVRAGMDQLLREKGLAAMTMHCDAVAAGVTTVDITDELVRLYQPPAQTLEWIAQLKDHEPASLVELADLPADR